MQNGLIFLVATISDLYIMTFVVRIVLQWNRSDPRNPLTQFILRVTNPLVIPARRIIPAAGRLDLATLIVALLVQLAAIAVLLKLAGIGMPAVSEFVWLGFLRLVHVVLRMYFFVLLIFVIMSWLSPGVYNPVTNVLASIAEPLLQPVRRILPAIGGFDLSPLVVLIGIQALTLMIPGRVLGGLFL
jgi:YggT family protein